MKNKIFGDITNISSYNEDNTVNDDRFRNEGIEFFSESDRNSARANNRPLRQLYEDEENNYELLQTLSKMVFMDKESGIIPGICEEFNKNKLKVGFFFGNRLEPYLRIPTGAFYVNIRNARTTYPKTEIVDDLKPKYSYKEEDDFNKSYYLNRDHDSAVVFNKPNVELFERELAKHYNVDLDEQTNDINVEYSIVDNEIKYNCDFTRFKYDSSNSQFVSTNQELTQTKNKQETTEFDNVFELVSATINKISSYPEKDGLFSLEETIPLFTRNSLATTSDGSSVYEYVSGDYCLFYRMGDYHSNEEVYRYSLTGNFGICKKTDDTFLLNNNDIKLFTFTLKRDSSTKQYTISNCVSLLPVLNRSSFDIKNLNVSNNYIGVDNVGWHLCYDSDISNMVK